eukprot:sb/3465515/
MVNREPLTKAQTVPTTSRFHQPTTNICFTRCQVERGGTTKMSDTFKQPVIVPDFLTPPENQGVCVNSDDDIEITPNLKYMMSDQVVVADAVQKLPGSIYKWYVHTSITSLYNTGGGVTKENQLKITQAKYEQYYKDTSKTCQYFSFFQTRDTDYQIVEVIKMRRPTDKDTCSDLTESESQHNNNNTNKIIQDVCNNAVVNVTDCNASDRKLTVKLQDKSAQCLSVQFVYRAPQGSLVTRTKTFDQTADKCGERNMEVSLLQSELSGSQLTVTDVYAIKITPQGKTGCTISNIDKICNSTNPGPGPEPTAAPNTGSEVGVIIGVTVGVLVLVSAGAGVAYFYITSQGVGAPHIIANEGATGGWKSSVNQENVYSNDEGFIERTFGKMKEFV